MEASNNNVLQSISVNPTSPTHVVNANWELEAGKSYKILLTEASSGKWTSYSSFPQSSANLRVDSTVNLSSSYSNYWFTFTNLQISSTGAPSAPEITQGTGPISLSVSEDEPSNWTTNQVSATDADSDSNSLTWSLSAAPSDGTANVSGTGSSPSTFSYSPNANFNGSDSFEIRVSDAENLSDSITVNVSVQSVDDAPTVANPISDITIQEDADLGSLSISSLFDDIDHDNSSIVISATSSNNSLLYVSVDGDFLYYEALPNTHGSAVVTLTGTSNGLTANDDFTVSITSVNDATTITGDFNVTLQEDGIATGDLNATDPDGLSDGTYFLVSSDPANGSASIDPVTGAWNYSANPDFHGSDSFTVSVTDDQNHSATLASVTLTITSVDDATIITGDFNGTLLEDGNVTGDLNATDPDGLSDGSYFLVSSDPANGTASIDPVTGAWNYSANPDFHGSDSFTVSVTDDQNHSATLASVTLTITSVDDATIITGDFNGTLFEDGNVTGDLNATDPDGLSDGTYFLVSSGPANGSASIDPVTGAWNYSANPDFHGSDSFTVSVIDDQNHSATLASVTLTITSVDDPTIITGDFNGTLLEDGNVTGDLNATDPDGLSDGTYFLVSSDPANGSASIDPVTGAWNYSANPDFHGSDSFTVSVTDDQNHSATLASVTLTITSVDDATIITGDFNGTLLEDGNVTGDLNATDPDGLSDGTYFLVSSDPANGTASIDPVTGSWNYSANPDFHGSDSFTVSVTDDQNHSATLASVTLTITSVDDATIITGDFNGTLLEDGNVTGDLNATDPDGLSDGTYFLVSSDPANGSVAIDPASGNWFYTSNPNFHGSDSFVVSVTDDQNHSASLSEIKLSILSVNDPTLVSGDFNSSILEGGYATGDLNATDADGLAHEETFLISTPPSNGSASIDSLTGQWTYAPRPYYYGVDSFIISIFDSQGVETQQQIDLEIESVPDPNPPIVEIISASIDSNGSLIATAELITDGGFTILEVGFDISSSHDFMDGTRQIIGLESNQSTFDITAPLSPSDNWVYLRPYARNLNGETYGQVRQISLSRSESRWSSPCLPAGCRMVFLRMAR